MFRITNIEKRNEQFSRQLGNDIIAEVAKIVRAKMSKEYIFVRYMGPKFVIVFSGVEETAVEQFLIDLKNEIEELAIVEDIDGENTEETEDLEKSASPMINMVVSTYYKGTGIEQLTKKLEEYVDTAAKSENQINFI
jgi:GGDEF domain-containing protein